jgi:imidazole glycerol-phosphate synthase subunit HisH
MMPNLSPIAIIDTGFCNLSSVVNALNYLHLPNKTIKSYSAGATINYSGFILPGVGSFQPAMNSLIEKQLDKFIYKLCDANIKGMGICLGMQLFTNWSLEGGSKTKGLGLFDCGVEPLSSQQATVPHIGWTRTFSTNLTISQNLNFNSNFYYVHSFVARKCSESYVASYFKHGNNQEISALQSPQLLAVQFHPEKSQKDGLQLFKSYFTY